VESIPDARNWRRDQGDNIVKESFEAIEIRFVEVTRVFLLLSRLDTPSLQAIDFPYEP